MCNWQPIESLSINFTITSCYLYRIKFQNLINKHGVDLMDSGSDLDSEIEGATSWLAWPVTDLGQLLFVKIH